MRVFVVQSYDTLSDGGDVEGVFSDRAKAVEFADTMSDAFIQEWELDGDPVDYPFSPPKIVVPKPPKAHIQKRFNDAILERHAEVHRLISEAR